MAFRVLICDDEPDIRSMMRRTLRQHDITEAGSPREALDLLKTSGFDAIVADFSMGAESDGLDLLQLCKVQYPDMIRFLVTATRDIDVAMRGVNEGAIHRYFLKPWDENKLRDALEIVLRSRNASGAPQEE